MTSDLSSQPTISQGQILAAIAAVSDLLARFEGLETFLQQVVDILRQRLDTDRVVVYRLLPNDDGVIAAESLLPNWQSLRGELIYDPCFAGGWGDRYRQGGIGLVADVQQANLEPCYAELMLRFQVQAKVVVPVLWGTTLWGLLIAHHCRSPRRWSSSSQRLMVQVARQLSLGLHHNELQQQLRAAQWQLRQLPTPGQAEQLLQLFTDHGEQLLFVRDAASGQFLYLSAAFEQIWGQPRAVIYSDATAWLRQVHPDDLAEVLNSVGQQFEGQSVRREYRIVRPNGDIRWIRAQVRVVKDGDQDTGFMVGWAEDCTDRKQLQAHLQAAEATLSRRVSQEQLLRMLTARMRESLDLQTILSAAVSGIKTVFNADRAIIFQILPNGDRRIVQQATQAGVVAITDAMIPPGPLPAQYLERLRQGQPIIHAGPASDLWSPEIVAFLKGVGVRSAMVAPIAHPVSGDARGDRLQHHQAVWGILVVHACGEPRQWQPFEANMLQHFGDQLTTALHQAELYHQLQAANQKLEHLSKVDSLTQLANRRCLDDYLRQEWQRLARQREPLSVVLADVDFFKPYNDTYGHAAGDRCLEEIANAIRQGIRRPADLAARYGGEEFALVLPNTSQAGAIRVVQMVRHHLETLALPHGANPYGNTITLSFGIATLIPDADGPMELILKAADQALYAAKAAGRNCYRIFGHSP
jgi:diguanylate cyclase (GGDEF)-like protein/PAS domain S-box-containing protein